ncbi:MAG TPA: hypothetical protein VL981_11150 [Candidatus Methylacidiphilales bacterium]|nr:hypothetical protein [Candidatus Methylacidiphilales bacterium]
MKIHYLLSALLLAGCASPNSPVAVDPGPLPQKHDGPDTAGVRVPEQLKAYPVGRYVDPDDPGLMHEGHTVYRTETSPDWDTDPNAPTYLPLGPGEMAAADPGQQHVALTAELEQRLKQEDQLLQTTYEQNERLSQEIKTLQTQLPQLRPPVPQNQPAPPSSVASPQPPAATPPPPQTPPVNPPSTASHQRTWVEWIHAVWSRSPQPATPTTKGNP